jgi:2-polyprenyl-3-methyl-5-hydroxy-6-metoxy-1,4-benzoquinol methylase
MVLTSSSGNSNSEEYNELFSDGEYEMHRKAHALLLQGKLPLEYHRQQLLRRIEKQIKGRRIIEIGGGTGVFGKFCSLRGWEYCDYDISSTAVEYAKLLGLCARTIDDPSHLDLPSADVITMWEVIEHIWNVHDYLKSIRRSLSKDGLLILSTPNYERRGYRTSDNWGKLSAPPIHINFFTQESVTLALKAAGFEDVKVLLPRLYRPSLTPTSIWYSIQLALRWEPTKTLYVVAGLDTPKI